MKNIFGVISAVALAFMVAGPAQAHCYKYGCQKVFYGCSKVVVSSPFFNPGGVWWIPNHYTPCGDFVQGYWSPCLPGYKLGCGKVLIPAHYSKFVGWVPARVTYFGYFR